jgi:hypothetical protein
MFDRSSPQVYWLRPKDTWKALQQPGVYDPSEAGWCPSFRFLQWWLHDTREQITTLDASFIKRSQIGVRLHRIWPAGGAPDQISQEEKVGARGSKGIACTAVKFRQRTPLNHSLVFFVHGVCRISSHPLFESQNQFWLPTKQYLSLFLSPVFCSSQSPSLLSTYGL